jgi:hypothetical protein
MGEKLFLLAKPELEPQSRDQRAGILIIHGEVFSIAGYEK